MSLRHLLPSLALTLVAACGGSATPIGTATVAGYAFDISYEDAAPDPGADTNFVLKPASGHPTTITGWVGSAGAPGSAKVAAVFDSGDGDYDLPYTIPDPLPPGSLFFFDVETDGSGAVGSIAF